jgi:hypothetical protein
VPMWELSSSGHVQARLSDYRAVATIGAAAMRARTYLIVGGEEADPLCCWVPELTGRRFMLMSGSISTDGRAHSKIGRSWVPL